MWVSEFSFFYIFSLVAFHLVSLLFPVISSEISISLEFGLQEFGQRNNFRKYHNLYFISQEKFLLHIVYIILPQKLPMSKGILYPISIEFILTYFAPFLQIIIIRSFNLLWLRDFYYFYWIELKSILKQISLFQIVAIWLKNRRINWLKNIKLVSSKLIKQEK